MMFLNDNLKIQEGKVYGQECKGGFMCIGGRSSSPPPPTKEEKEPGMEREAQKRAELRMAIEYPNITNTITLQRLGKEAMRQGKVEDAIRVQQTGETNRKLLEYGGAR